MRIALAVAAIIGVTCGMRSVGNAAPFTLAGGSNKACELKVAFQWDGSPAPFLGAGMAVIPPPPGPWSGLLYTHDAPQPDRLFALLRHGLGKPPTPCHSGETENTKSLSLELSDMRPPAGRFRSRTTADQVAHGSHWDIGTLRSSLFPTAAGAVSGPVEVKGLHGGTAIGKVVPSYSNDFSADQVTVELKADYRVKDGAGWKIVDGGKVLDTARVSYKESTKFRSLESYRDDVPSGGVRTSYRIKVVGSPFTDTHLAFLGRVDGVFMELDLDLAMFALLGPDTPFFVPNLKPFPDSDATDLYVAVDLTQWLGAMPDFAAGDVFSLVDGASESLPGFLVSLSPIALGDTGWVTDSPYTGEVVVTGRIDGSVETPAPATLTLLSAALGLLAWRRATGHGNSFMTRRAW